MPNQIVIFLRNRPFFGARITTLPALYHIRKSFPEHKILLFSKNNESDFYFSTGWIDDFLVSKSLLKDMQKLPRNASAFLSFQPSSKRDIIAKIIKQPSISIGFSKNGDFLSKLYDRSLNFEKAKYRAQHYLELSLLATEKESNRLISLENPFLELSKKGRCSAIKEKEVINILLMPGGGAGEFKKWGHMKFIHTAQKIRAIKNKKIISHLVLGPDERQEAYWIKKQNFENTVIHFSLDLPSLCKLITLADLVISNDCGPSHIAQCLGVPFVGIYTHNNTEWFRETERSIMLNTKEGQSIKDIKIEEVLEASLSVLGRRY